MSRERKDVNVYFCCVVVTRIAFGITNAVMRFSSAVTSYMGMQSCTRAVSVSQEAGKQGRDARP